MTNKAKPITISILLYLLAISMAAQQTPTNYIKVSLLQTPVADTAGITAANSQQSISYFDDSPPEY